MYIIRDIFYLQFGHYRDVKKLLDEARDKKLFPEAQQMRILTDFTGESYRLILEEGYEKLADYEQSLQGAMQTDDWQKWYAQFKEHVASSEREILKEIY